MSSDRIQHAGSPMTVPPGLPEPGGDDAVDRPPSPRQRASTAPDGLRNLRSASQSPARALRGPAAPRNPAPTVKPELAGSSSSSAARPADADPRLAFNQALKQVATVWKFVERLGDEAFSVSSKPLLTRMAEQMMEHTQRGLDAYGELPADLRIHPDVKADYEVLEMERLKSAVMYLVQRDHTQPSRALGRDLPAAGADAQTIQTYRDELANTLTGHRKDFACTQAAHQGVVEGLRRGLVPPDVAQEANFYAVCHQTFSGRRIIDLTTLRMQSHREDLSPTLVDVLDAHAGVLDAHRQAYDHAYSVLMHEDVDAQALPAALDVMVSVREQLDGSGRELCLAAAREIEEGSEQWKVGLECADAVRIFSSSLSDLMDRAAKHVRAASIASGTGSTSSVSAPPRRERPEVLPQAALPAGGGSRSRSRRAGRRQAPAAAAVPVVQGPRSLALGTAKQALATSRPLTLDLMAQGNPADIARSLFQDTRTIDLIRRHHADPIYIAKCLRQEAPKWFGDVDRLRSASERLASLPSVDQSAPDLQELSAQLRERIGALAALPEWVTTCEMDDIKQYAFPQEKHLDRLLELGQIAHVGRPVRLPSARDVGSAGTLFEMRIQPTPLANGSSSPALYLHLHTETPVTPQAAIRLSLDEFSAVHVKTAEQKGFGRNWEQMRQKLGHDDEVHRGPIGAVVLKKLREMVAGTTG